MRLDVKGVVPQPDIESRKAISDAHFRPGAYGCKVGRPRPPGSTRPAVLRRAIMCTGCEYLSPGPADVVASRFCRACATTRSSRLISPIRLTGDLVSYSRRRA